MVYLEPESERPVRVSPKATLSARRVLGLAVLSSARFAQLVVSGSTSRPRDRIGDLYRVEGEDPYQVFRETVSDDGARDPPAVLVVGFRMRAIGSNRVLHWAFQRLSILTTPIWGGFRGYRVKLWMVDPRSKDYLGIYEWAGEKNAQSYANWLACLLLPLSTEDSVWYELHKGRRLDRYLADHSVRPDS